VKRISCLIAGLVAALLFVVPAVASSPTATTSGAINVTATSATLVGYLNPGQVFSAYAFEYGKTTSYGTDTPPQAVPAGSGQVEVTATVTGLSPDTTYHFQLVGATQPSSNTAAQYYFGGDQTLTTASSTSSGSGSGSSGSSAKGSLRLVGKTLQVSRGKALVALWCVGKHACRGQFSISSSGKACVAGKSFSIGATKVKAIKVSLRAACKKLMRKASKHTIHGKLKATLSTGQPSLSSKITFKPRT
jgi:hypothetical protein